MKYKAPIKNNKKARQERAVENFFKGLKEERKNYIQDTFEKGVILDNDYPVYWDYMYFADDKFIKSDVQGTVGDLKRDLISQGIVFENIYTCVYKH